MGRIQGYLDDVLKKELNPQNLLFLFVRRKMKGLGGILSREQERKLQAQLANPEKGFTLSVQLTDEDGRELTAEEEQRIEAELTKAFGDPREIEEFGLHISEMIVKMMREVVPVVADTVWSAMRKRSKVQTRLLQKDRAQFSSNGMKPWKQTLSLLELLVSVSSELGSEFALEGERDESEKSNTPLEDVLKRLHARGCQVASEVHWLLKGGYADGAYARWRTLHEISVVADYLTQGKNGLAQMYLDHLDVERYKIALQYQEHCSSFRWERLSEDELDALKSGYDARIREYGQQFANDYGWAAQALHNRSPKFSDIERQVDLGHMRPIVKFASQNIHAGPTGTFQRVGVMMGEQETVLLAGSSNIGIADPAHNTALSLILLNCTLLLAKPNMDRAVAIHVMLKMQDELENLLVVAQQQFIAR